MSDHEYDDTYPGDWPDDGPDRPHDVTYDDLVRHIMTSNEAALVVLREHARRPPVQVPDYGRRDQGSDGGGIAAAVAAALPHILDALGDRRPETPPGMVLLEECRLENILDECDRAKTRAEDLETELKCEEAHFRELLSRVSVMLGYEGRVDSDFERMLKGRPQPSDPPTAYLLPDGSHTNVVTEALVAWQDVSPAAVKEARDLALARATGNAPEPEDGA